LTNTLQGDVLYPPASYGRRWPTTQTASIFSSEKHVYDILLGDVFSHVLNSHLLIHLLLLKGW